MKQIYWIDDNFMEMFFISQGAISKLWKLDDEKIKVEQRIRSVMVIFGDANMNTDILWSEKDESDAAVMLRDHFVECCLKYDGPDPARPKYTENKALVQNAVNYVLVREEDDDIKLYKELKESWCNKETDSPDSSIEEQIKKLVEKINIENPSLIGIDLSLLSGDVERIKSKRVVISMGLYNFLEKKYKCFLYSAEAEDTEFADNWIETYKKKYKGECKKIYKRKDFLSKGEIDIVKELEKMFEQESTIKS